MEKDIVFFGNEHSSMKSADVLTCQTESLQENVISVRVIKDPDMIYSIMKECDSAFERSIIHRDNFPEIFEKVTRYADFFTAYFNDGKEMRNPVGYAAVYANDYDNKKAFITLICVKPEMQGLHVGSKLINACFQLARERDMRIIRLETMQNNLKAISFYKHHGFSVEGYTDEDSLFMVKDLQIQKENE